MKKYSFILVTMMIILSLGACTEDNDMMAPNQEEVIINIGDVHTELLTAIYANADPVTNKSLKQTDKDQIIVDAVNQITDKYAKYGVERMNREEILGHVERGRQMARRDPVELILELLSSDEQEWWNRFSLEAEVSNARKVYRKHCELYGTPEPGSMLANILDVGLSSAEFWRVKRVDDIQTYHNPYVPQDQQAKSWAKFIRFAVSVVVDGTAGGLAGAGTSFTGPGAAVVGGVVGGLASSGADHLLYG